MANGSKLRRAREIQRSKWQDVEDAEREKEENTKEELLIEVQQVDNKHFAGRKLNNEDLKAIIKFVVPLEGRDDKNRPSQYFKNAETMKERIASCDQLCHSYLAPTAAMMGEAESDDESVGNESAPDEPNDESEAPLDLKRLAYYAKIYRQMLAIDSDTVEMGLMCSDNFNNDEGKELEDYIEYVEELLAEANEK